MHQVKIKRIYSPAEPEDGFRVLVDRLWPRGVSKSVAQIDLWEKVIAPSSELRTWFGHQPERFPLFQTSYISELNSNADAQSFAAECREKLTQENVTLLFAAKNETCNHAIVLRDWIVHTISE